MSTTLNSAVAEPATTVCAPEATADGPIYEFCDWDGTAPRVDRSRGILRGVKILGVRSQNGRVYLPEALAAAAGLYEGAKVNVNHPKGHPRAPRDYQERIGTLRTVSVRPGEGLYGDFHFNPRHALAEQLLWDAAHAPQNVGFSHNVEAKMARRSGEWSVEAITRVVSVDLVADPATTAGLFEAADGEKSEAHAGAGAASLLAETSANEKLHSGDEPTARLASGRRGLLLAEENVALRAELAELRRQADELLAAADLSQRRELASALLAEHRLPPPHSSDPADRAITSAAFMAALLEAPDEAAMRRLVAERAALVEAARGAIATIARPISRAPGNSEVQPRPLDTLGFVRAVRG